MCQPGAGFNRLESLVDQLVEAALAVAAQTRTRLVIRGLFRSRIVKGLPTGLLALAIAFGQLLVGIQSATGCQIAGLVLILPRKLNRTGAIWRPR